MGTTVATNALLERRGARRARGRAGEPGKTFADLVTQPSGAYVAKTLLSLVRTAVEEEWIENGKQSDDQ